MACNGYTIQSVAKRCGMTTHTLRYYERIGLIRPVTREQNGRRCYSPGDVRWLRFLHFMRITHMPIRDLQQWVSLRLAGGTGALEQHRILEDHRTALRGQIANLEKACALLTDYLDKAGTGKERPSLEIEAPGMTRQVALRTENGDRMPS